MRTLRISTQPAPGKRRPSSLAYRVPRRRPEALGVLPRPIGQPCLAGGRGVRAQQVRHEPLDFLPGDHHVAQELAENPADRKARRRRHPDDPAVPADRLRDRLDQLAVRESLRPDRIDDHVVVPTPVLHGQGREIIHVDRLQPVGAVAEDAEDRQLPQHPGDVVDQDVVAAEQHRRPQDGMREPRLDQAPLQPGLSLEILQRRVLRRVRDADVHDAPDTGLLRGGKERQGVAHRVGERKPLVVEPHPVRVVEDRRSRQ